MSFFFPANPKDGDIVVQPQPDGSYIKGEYNSATDTWAVGELPEEPGIPGPQGPQGPPGPAGAPGEGMSVSGIVNTFDELPDAPAHPLEFWIVDDVNKVYYSNGVTWFDQGGPIRGPQGEPGTDGTDGTDGQDGAPGKGWTGTTIIDETDQSPPNYQIRFESDDNLGFVTDNLVGPQGETGSLQVASATRLGGIKIGRGLNILPDGTAQAGETNVDLETVPLTPEGTVYNYNTFTLSLAPQFDSWLDNLTGSQNGSSGSGRGWTESHRWTVTMPDDADMAIVYYFSAAGASTYAVPGSIVPCWFSGQTKVEAEGATFEDGGNIGVPHDINITTLSQQQTLSASTPTLKIGLVRFLPGAEVTFIMSAMVRTARKMSWSIGRGRLAIMPYKTAALDEAATVNGRSMAQFIEEFAENQYPGTDFDGLPPITPEENVQLEADAMKQEIAELMQLIDMMTVQQYPPSDTDNYNALMEIRQNLFDMRDLPGSADDLEELFNQYNAQVYAFYNYTFRYE